MQLGLVVFICGGRCGRDGSYYRRGCSRSSAAKLCPCYLIILSSRQRGNLREMEYIFVKSSHVRSRRFLTAQESHSALVFVQIMQLATLFSEIAS